MSVYNINYSTTFNIYRVVTDNSILSVSKNKKKLLWSKNDNQLLSLIKVGK